MAHKDPKWDIFDIYGEYMKLSKQVTDQAILTEIGERIARARLNRNLSQAQLATTAGVSKRTLERLESGESVQLTNFVRLLRALDRMEALDGILTEGDVRPMDLLQREGKPRRRASGERRKESAESDEAWTWGDD